VICLKTFLIVISLAAAGLTCTLGPLHALPNSTDERLRVFSICAGRYSALMEHQWLTNDPDSDHSEALRSHFVDLVDALLPVARESGLSGAQPLGWRISAKAALRGLLHRATYEQGRGARLAQAQVRRFMAQCDGMVLG